jgi:hypothetical protein
MELSVERENAARIRRKPENERITFVLFVAVRPREDTVAVREDERAGVEVATDRDDLR